MEMSPDEYRRVMLNALLDFIESNRRGDMSTETLSAKGMSYE